MAKCGPRATCGPPTFICGPSTFFIIKSIKLHSNYRPKGIKNDKMWKQSSKVKNVRPAMKNIFKIWSSSKKVWPLLRYTFVTMLFATSDDDIIKCFTKCQHCCHFQLASSINEYLPKICLCLILGTT